MRFLLFRLYAPLAAWGTTAVGQERPSDAHPGKSAVCGLLAAALGIRRDEEDRLAALHAGYGFAVRVDVPGVALRDYHTAQVPSRVDLKGRPRSSRRDELAVARHKLNTVLSAREYRCDALYTALLWARPTAPVSLDELCAALWRPMLPLYLGRKSCAPGLPLEAQCVDAESLLQALDQTKFRAMPDLPLALERGPVASSLHWEDDPLVEAGVPVQMTVRRRDVLGSRRRWQFVERDELRATLPFSKGA